MESQTISDSLVIRCTKCGAKNRVPRSRLEQDLQPVCGRCGTPLPVGIELFPVTDATFAAEVERSELPVLVDAWAPWCGPCRMITPVLHDLAAEMAGRLRVAKLNVDENPVTASRLRIQSLPSLLFFRGGREVDRLIGVQPKAEIARRIERALA
jgi:thioredoxin 2